MKTIDSVVHFVAYSLVGESTNKPIKYFRNNLGGTINLVNNMIENGIKYFVFSSTAAVYGEPKNIPIIETDCSNQQIHMVNQVGS